MVSAKQQTVWELLQSRQREQSRPGQRTDNHRLALSLEGGGMRGVAVGGMVSALYDLGLLPLFDDVYGTSAGAMTGAYLLQGTPHEGTSLFPQQLANRTFLRPWLTPVGGALNLDHLFDVIVARRQPLSAQQIADSGIRFHPLAANAHARQAVDLSREADLRQQHELLWALRAAVRVPIACGNPWVTTPELWRDAGLHEAIPLATPIADGVTHLLVLRSLPEGISNAEAVSGVSRVIYRSGGYLYQKTCRRWGITGYRHEETRLAAALDKHIVQVRPTGPAVGTMEHRPARVAAYGQRGYDSFQSWWAKNNSA